MYCLPPYIYTGTDGERLSSERASSLLDKISHKVRTLLEGSRFITSIWGKAYVDQDTRHLEEHCGWLEQQLMNTWQEHGKVISMLNSAHSKAILDQ